MTEESGDTSTFEFHPNGSLALHRHLNPDGSEWNTIYEYDDTSRLRVRRSGDAVGNTNLRLYEYDDSGRLSRIIERTEGGSDRVVESYDYSSYGRKTKTQCVDLTSQRRNTHYSFGVEGTDTCYSAPGAATLTTLYNEREQPIEVVFCDVTGRRLSGVEFLYDTAGNLVDESQTTAVEALPAEMTASLNQAQLETVRALCGAAMMHRYDEQGHRVETRSRLGSIGGDIKTMTYNEHGDQIGEVNEREGAELHPRRGRPDLGQPDAGDRDAFRGPFPIRLRRAWQLGDEDCREPEWNGQRFHGIDCGAANDRLFRVSLSDPDSPAKKRAGSTHRWSRTGSLRPRSGKLARVPPDLSRVT